MLRLNKWQKELIQLGIEEDSRRAKVLQRMYRATLRDVRKKLKSYDEALPYWQQLRQGSLLQLERELSEVLEASGLAVEDFTRREMAKEFERGYDELFYLAEQESKIPLTFNYVPKETVSQLIDNPLLGQTLSSNLWANRNDLSSQVNRILNTSIMQGETYGEVAKQLALAINADYYKTARIVRTESHRLHSLGQLESYDEARRLGVEAKKRWSSALDSRTRSTHQSLDGQTKELDGYFTSPSGARAKGPGLFGVASEDINCRCTTIAVFEDYKPSVRIDADGLKVPSGMSYKEWKKWKRN